jgi:hypothetical protein
MSLQLECCGVFQMSIKATMISAVPKLNGPHLQFNDVSAVTAGWLVGWHFQPKLARGPQLLE